jgi:hypothetical protein
LVGIRIQGLEVRETGGADAAFGGTLFALKTFAFA